MLIRFDPFREFDRLTEQLASTATRVPRGFPMDAYRRGDQFIVEFDLPGVEPASIDLTVENNVLSVRSERRFEPREGDEVLVAERPHGTYTRQLFLADTLDSENVQADYEHGVLTLTIPVAEAAKPRRVQVGGGQDVGVADEVDPAALCARCGLVAGGVQRVQQVNEVAAEGLDKRNLPRLWLRGEETEVSLKKLMHLRDLAVDPVPGGKKNFDLGAF